MALGADRTSISRLVVGETLVVVAAALAAGAPLALWASQLIRAKLFNMTPADPLVMVGVVVMLAATAAVTLVLPVRRATRVDPIVTLREEQARRRARRASGPSPRRAGPPVDPAEHRS